jgi:hypothetical protein
VYKRLAEVWSKMKGLRISARSRNMNLKHMQNQIFGMDVLQKLDEANVIGTKDMMGMLGGGDK